MSDNELSIEASRDENARESPLQKIQSLSNALERRSRDNGLLIEMIGWIKNCTTDKEMYFTAGATARQLFPYDSGAICSVGRSEDMVEVVYSWGDTPPCKHFYSRRDCHALNLGYMHRVEPDEQEARCPHHPSDATGRLICIPMLVRGELLGVFHLHSTFNAELDPGHQWKDQLALSFAEGLGLVASNMKLRESMVLQSVRDMLTGVFNLHYMEESLDREIRRSLRSQRPLGLLILGVNASVAKIRESGGPHAADTVLIAIANYLETHVRASDVIGRQANGEFMIILPEISLEMTAQRAVELMEGVRSLTLSYQGAPVEKLHVAVGVSAYPQHGNSARDLLHAANDGLNRAQNSGPNQVIVGNPA